MRVVHVAAPSMPMVEAATLGGFVAQLPDREDEHARGDQHHAEARAQHEERGRVGQLQPLERIARLPPRPRGQLEDEPDRCA